MPDANDLIHFCDLVDQGTDDELAQMIDPDVEVASEMMILDLIAMRELVSRALTRLSLGDILGYKGESFGLHTIPGGKLTH